MKKQKQILEAACQECGASKISKNRSILKKWAKNHRCKPLTIDIKTDERGFLTEPIRVHR